MSFSDAASAPLPGAMGSRMGDQGNEDEEGNLADLERSIQAYRDCIFDQSLLWRGIIDRIGHAGAANTLNQLSKNSQNDLQRFYRERPWELGVRWQSVPKGIR
jgi:hypothetical protein